MSDLSEPHAISQHFERTPERSRSASALVVIILIVVILASRKFSLAGLHFVVFAILMLLKAVPLLKSS